MRGLPVRLSDPEWAGLPTAAEGDGRQALELSLEYGFIRSKLARVAANARRPNRAAGITG